MICVLGKRSEICEVNRLHRPGMCTLVENITDDNIYNTKCGHIYSNIFMILQQYMYAYMGTHNIYMHTCKCKCTSYAYSIKNIKYVAQHINKKYIRFFLTNNKQISEA